MKLFLDASVIVAACGSSTGAAAKIIRLAETNDWTLVVTSYLVAEAERNIPKLGPFAVGRWATIKHGIVAERDVFSINRPTVFGPTKDRPVLFSALAWAEVLLTLDRGDFQDVLGSAFYGLRLLTPGDFIEAERAAGRLIDPP